MQEFGKKLKNSIKQNGYTQKDIARILSINKATVSIWIKGKAYPTLEKFQKLCIILDESADYLLGLNN